MLTNPNAINASAVVPTQRAAGPESNIIPPLVVVITGYVLGWPRPVFALPRLPRGRQAGIMTTSVKKNIRLPPFSGAVPHPIGLAFTKKP